jgi:hypothetical protein
MTSEEEEGRFMNCAEAPYSSLAILCIRISKDSIRFICVVRPFFPHTQPDMLSKQKV